MPEHPFTLAQETVVISAFRNGVSVDVIAEVIGTTPTSVEKLLKKIGLKTNAREALGDDDDAEPSQTNVAEQFRKGDLAFQNAMRRAIKRGLERPPMIGTFKDDTVPDHHRHFVPAPLYSSCGSPARDCAELCSPFN
jgi:hypothetical protein